MNEIVAFLTETINRTHHWLYYQAPKLAFALGIFGDPVALAKMIKSTSVKVMKAVKLDTLSQNVGIDDFLARGNIREGPLRSFPYWSTGSSYS